MNPETTFKIPTSNKSTTFVMSVMNLTTNVNSYTTTLSPSPSTHLSNHPSSTNPAHNISNPLRLVDVAMQLMMVTSPSSEPASQHTNTTTTIHHQWSFPDPLPTSNVTTTSTAIPPQSPHTFATLTLQQTCLLAFFSTVIIITVLGNTLILLAVITTRRLRTVTNCFVLSLAVADWMVGIFVMPPSVLVYVYGRFGIVLCFTLFFLTPIQ